MIKQLTRARITIMDEEELKINKTHVEMLTIYRTLGFTFSGIQMISVTLPGRTYFEGTTDYYYFKNGNNTFITSSSVSVRSKSRLEELGKLSPIPIKMESAPDLMNLYSSDFNNIKLISLLSIKLMGGESEAHIKMEPDDKRNAMQILLEIRKLFSDQKDYSVCKSVTSIKGVTKSDEMLIESAKDAWKATKWARKVAGHIFGK